MSLSLFRGFAAKGALLWDAGEIEVLPSFVPVLWGWAPFRSSSLFLMLDEMTHVFVRVHTRLISA